MLLPLVALAGTGLTTFRGSVGALEEFRNETVDETKLIENVRDLLPQADDLGEEYAETGDQAVGRRFDSLARRIDRGFDGFATLSSERERKLGAAGRGLWTQASVDLERAASLPPGGNVNDALDPFHDNIDGAAETLADLHSLNSQQVAGEIASQQARERAQLVASLAIVFGGLLVAGLLARLVRRTISRPLLAIEEAAVRFGGGELSHRVPLTGDDELGRVGSAFNAMADSLDRSTEELETSERRFRSLVESAPDGVVMLASSGEIALLNGEAERMFGYERDELLGQTIDVLLPAGLSTEEEPGLEQVALHKDGSEFPADVSLSAIETDDGTIVICFVRDVSERARLELQLRQSQKMEAVGQLAGGIAHDFNNILLVIKGYSTLLVESLGNTDEAADAQEIDRAADRAAGLTRQLLAFSRKQVIQPTLLDLNDSVESYEKLLSRLLGEQIALVTTLTADDVPIEEDPAQIEQLLVNLTVNARDAMPEGGTMTISTETVTVDDSLGDVNGIAAGRYAALRVADTGIGMDTETVGRIFEPFFTTKPTGEGTGLGLATVYGIVAQSDGRIEVDSTPGEGTLFTIYLPLATGGDAEPKHAVVETRRHLGSETILVVEDEDPVRSLVCRLLRARGYDVIEAARPSHALAIADDHHFDLLLTDVVMPEMRGPKLAERLRAERPELPVVYMSGYSDAAIGAAGVLDDSTVLLQKPFESKMLAQKIRQVLDASHEDREAADLPAVA